MRIEAPVTTYVVDDRVPWPNEDHRGFGQADYLRARLQGVDGTGECEIQRISCLGAAICGEPLGETGGSVAIELVTGQRLPATVDWARGREAGLRFDERVDVIALINRNLVAQPKERRALPRIELRVPVHLKWAEHFEPALTRNISARGMQVEGANLPSVGTYVSPFLEGPALPPCDVVWRREGLAGLEFFEELSWASIIPWVKGVSRNQGQP